MVNVSMWKSPQQHYMCADCCLPHVVFSSCVILLTMA